MNANPTHVTTAATSGDEDLACYVLVSCGKPTSSGEMPVQCTFEGDTLLAAYLLEKAQRYLEGQIDLEAKQLGRSHRAS